MNDLTSQQKEDTTKHTPQKYWIPEKFDERKIPDVINKIRQNKQRLLGESKIVELTKKFQFEKYAFSRLTENENFEHARLYIACFYLNEFKVIR